MNSGMNVFGQGNRANSSIGRALQLVIRNVGGGRPGEVDRATFGNPGKLSFCFAEDEEGSPWQPLSVDLGAEPGSEHRHALSRRGPAQHHGPALARAGVARARSFAVNLRTLHHPKLVLAFDCVLAVGPEHARVFARGRLGQGAKLCAAARAAADSQGSELVRGAGGIAEGMPEAAADATLPKFKPGRPFSSFTAAERRPLLDAMIGGWVAGEIGSQPSFGRSKHEYERHRAERIRPRSFSTRPASASPASASACPGSTLDGQDRRAARHLEGARRPLPRPARGAAARARRRPSSASRSPPSPSRRPSTCATRSRSSATPWSKHSPIEAAARRAVCTTRRTSRRRGIPASLRRDGGVHRRRGGAGEGARLRARSPMYVEHPIQEAVVAQLVA